jgi:hypothetical protein
LATRQAWRSPAAPAQPCFWLAWSSASTTMRARECRRSSAVVRRYARSLYSLLLGAAHEKAQSHAAPLCAHTSSLRGSTGAVLQRGRCERGSRPKFRERRRRKRPLAAPAPPQRTLSAQQTRNRARSALGLGATASVYAPTSLDRLGR